MKQCFECGQAISEDLYSGVRVHGKTYDFHRNCARNIVAQHIQDTLDRDAWAEQRMSEKLSADKLADKLGFQSAVPAGQQPFIFER